MELTDKDVQKVAKLARLNIQQAEADRLTGEMNSILGYIDKLAELNTDGVEPTFHASAANNAFREDVCKRSLPVEEGLANAPASEDGSFKVPKVIE